MATLNEVKYATMLENGATGGKINELEHDWLGLQGVTIEGSLNEKWYSLFGGSGSWNGAAHAWLTTEGIPEGGSLNERFYKYWAGGGGSGTTLISDTDAVAVLWTPRGTNTVVDAPSASAVEITNVDNDEGAYLRLSTTTILTEALVDGQTYRVVFTSKTAGTFYIGLASQPQPRLMRAGLNGADFKPQGSTDLAASFLNISLPEGVGQIEAIDWAIRVWKLA